MLKKFIQFLLGEPKGYVSETDQFLAKLRRNDAKKLSVSQLAEIAKHKRITLLRDSHVVRVEAEAKTDLWRHF